MSSVPTEAWISEVVLTNFIVPVRSNRHTITISLCNTSQEYIKKLYGDKISISVAGYPEGHPEGEYEKDLRASHWPSTF